MGRNCYLLEIGPRRIIVDCGVGFDTNSLPPVEEDGIAIDAILITHGHGDHIGELPILASQHPEANIFATAMTKKLIEVSLADVLNFTRKSGEQLPFREGRLVELLERITVVEFGEWVSPWEGFRLCFWGAGHIPGAASILIDSPAGTIMVSGDISFFDEALVRGARPPELFRPQSLIAAAQHGHLTLPNRSEEEKRLQRKVADVLARGGNVLIPGFAFGRAPEMAASLAQAGFSVHVGGLASQVYKTYGLPRENIRFVGEQKSYEDDLLAILKTSRNIVVATPGMLDSGMSRDLAYMWMEEPANAIFIVGFQAEGATGRELLKLNSGDVLTFPERVEGRRERTVLAEIERFNFSGHADGNQLTEWVGALAPETLVLVHGGYSSFYGLKRRLREAGASPARIEVGRNKIPIQLGSA